MRWYAPAWPHGSAWIPIAIFPALVFAQAGPGVAPRPERLELPAAPAAPAGSLQLKPLPAPGAALVLGAPVFVSAFRIVGADSVAQDELAALLSPWMERTLDAAQLTRAAEVVTAYLRGKGLLVAQATIPAQEIRDGVVELTVIEGRIASTRLEVAEDSRVSKAAADRFLAHLRPGDTLRRDNVEHSLLLLNDLPGARLSATLAPADQAGAVNIEGRLENDGAPVSGTLRLDNAGIRGVGEYRALLDARWKSPLGLGDLLGVGLMQSSEGAQTRASVTYGLPVNGLGTRIGARYTEQRYRLGREFIVLDAKGESRATALLASHPLIRRNDYNLILSLSYTELATHDRQNAVGFVSDTRQHSVGAGLAADARDSFLGGGVTEVQVQYLSGRVMLDTPVLAALDTAPVGLGVSGAFSVLRLRAERLQGLDSDSSLLFALTGQLASKNLDAGSELVVGGPDAVRAYPAGELYADQGYYGRIEYRRALPLFASERSVASLFLDIARVEVNRNPGAGDTANKRGLSGFGVGLHQVFGGGFSLQTSLAWKESKDRPTAAPERAPRVWISASLQF